VTDKHTEEILSKYIIEPEKNYWRYQLRNPGRWPGFSQICNLCRDSSHLL
jgi:hypothetical protein